jgi:YgiT-type zinc finger domain-containing protein
MIKVVEMPDKCNFCGNKNFINASVQYMYKHNGNFLLVNNVPCIQCEYCGEQYFDGKVLEKIEDDYEQLFVKGNRIPDKTMNIPVEDFVAV